MTVVAAVAGPSRLPMAAVRQSVRRLRHVAVTKRQASSAPSSDGQSSDAGVGSEGGTEGDETMMGYRQWLSRTGRQYESVRKGQRATWLGGDVPFPANPSFRPPPPLSNDLQNVIYDQLRSGATVAQLSHRYNISKARIEAVRKLKDVEREFQRQRLPVQEAFLGGMEDLLGVRSPLNPKTKALDVSRERDEATSRALHASSGIERTEEDRWEAGIGHGGAFGQRTAQTERESIERTVWEFRDEETAVMEKRAATTKQAAPPQPDAKQAMQEVAVAQAASDTPETQRIAAELAHAPKASANITPKTPSTQAGKYTFTNVSGQDRWKVAGTGTKPKR